MQPKKNENKNTGSLSDCFFLSLFLIVTIEKKKKIGLPKKMEGFLVTSLLLSSVYQALSFL